MENRIKNWLESLDLFGIKNPDEMKLQWHNFIQACQGDGMDITGYEDFTTLEKAGFNRHYALKTIHFTPKKMTPYEMAIASINEDNKKDFRTLGFSVTKDKKLFSTDGARLFLQDYDGNLGTGNYKNYTGKALKILKAMSYNEYKELCKKRKANASFRHIIFDFNDTENLFFDNGTWFEKLDYETLYNNYQKVLPDENKLIRFDDSIQNLCNGLNTAMQLFKLNGGSKNIIIHNQIKVSFREHNVCFNAKHLLDGFTFLSQFCNIEDISFRFTPTIIKDKKIESEPAIISDPSGKIMYIIMPLRECAEMIIANQMQPAPQKPVKKSAKPAAPEKPAIVEPVQEVQEVLNVVESQETPVLEALPESEAITPVNQQSPVFKRENIRTSGLSPRAIKNLSFVQIINGDQMSRFEFIRGMSEAGILKTAIWEDSKGKLHYLVNGQFLGQVAYNYANSIIAGNIKIAMA